MDPIILRLPPDLLEDLSDEADEHGFSSRSDGNSATAPTAATTGPTTAALEARVEALEERIVALEKEEVETAVSLLVDVSSVQTD